MTCGTRVTVGIVAADVVGLDGMLGDVVPPATAVVDGLLEEDISEVSMVELEGRPEDDWATPVTVGEGKLEEDAAEGSSEEREDV